MAAAAAAAAAAMSFDNSGEFEFEPGYDAFPDAGVFRETQTTLHPDYRLVAEMHWNESDEETPRLIEELKEAARNEGLSVPGDLTPLALTSLS